MFMPVRVFARRSDRTRFQSCLKQFKVGLGCILSLIILQFELVPADALLLPAAAAGFEELSPSAKEVASDLGIDDELKALFSLREKRAAGRENAGTQPN